MEINNVPYMVYEGTIARFERTVKRLVIVIVITVVSLFASNIAWLYAWNMYDYESTNIIVDGESNGDANCIEAGVNGVINHGENNSAEESKTFEKR